MDEIEQHETYEATVRIRRGEGWNPKPEAEALDGQRFRFVCGWRQDEDDPYPGEFAMMPRPWWENGIVWIASGDLVDIVRVEVAETVTLLAELARRTAA